MLAPSPGMPRSHCFGLNARPPRKFGFSHPLSQIFGRPRLHRRSAKRWVVLQRARETRGQETVAQEDGTSLYDRALGLAPRPTEFGKQEIDGMPRKLAVAVSALGIVAGALALGTPAQAQGVKAGVLTCNVSSGFGFIFGSSKSVNCNFSPPGSPPQHYVGSIDKFGVDIGY